MIKVVGTKKERVTKIAYFHIQRSFVRLLGNYMNLVDHKALEEEDWVLKKACSLFVVKLYGFHLSTAYIARPRHPYIESLLTL